MKHLRTSTGRTDRERGKSDLEREQDLEESAMEINPEELREFLEADLLGVRADPVFKERLRRKLWTLVRTRYGKSPGPGGSSGPGRGHQSGRAAGPSEDD